MGKIKHAVFGNTYYELNLPTKVPYGNAYPCVVRVFCEILSLSPPTSGRPAGRPSLAAPFFTERRMAVAENEKEGEEGGGRAPS